MNLNTITVPPSDYFIDMSNFPPHTVYTSVIAIQMSLTNVVHWNEIKQKKLLQTNKLSVDIKS